MTSAPGPDESCVQTSPTMLPQSVCVIQAVMCHDGPRGEVFGSRKVTQLQKINAFVLFSVLNRSSHLGHAPANDQRNVDGDTCHVKCVEHAETARYGHRQRHCTRRLLPDRALDRGLQHHRLRQSLQMIYIKRRMLWLELELGATANAASSATLSCRPRICIP